MSNPIVETPEYLRRVNAALALREVPDYPAALEQLKKALEQAPRDVDVLLALGLTYQDMEHFGQAEHYFRMALGLEPDSEPVRAALAGLLSTSWYQRDEVLTLLSPLIERGTLHPDIWYYYSVSVLDKLGNDGFPELLETAVTAFAPAEIPTAVQDQMWRARTERLMTWGTVEKALEIAEEGLHRLPTSQWLKRAKAWALIRVGMYQEGLQLIEQLQLTGMSNLKNEEYFAYLGIEQIDEAEYLASQLREKGTNYSEAAIRLYWQGLLDSAAVAAEDAVSYEQFTVLTGLTLAQILAEAHKPDIARAAVSRVLTGDVDPDDEDVDWYIEYLYVDVLAEAALGYTSLIEGTYEDAIKHLEKAETEAIEREPSEIIYSVAACYEERIIDSLPSHDDDLSILQAIRANLATAYQLNGSIEQALVAANNAIQVETDAPEDEGERSSAYKPHAVLGCVHLAAGNPQQAREAWQEALSRVSDVSEMEKATTLLQQWLTDLENNHPTNQTSN